jgi:hypothetical protein
MSEPFKFDTNAVFAYLYILYKTNMISRNNLRAMLDEMKKPWPEDVVKYLVQESIL